MIAIENGQRPPSSATIAHIAEVLDVRLRDLVSLPPTDEEALGRFRGLVRGNDALRGAVDAIVDFRRYAVLIEAKAGKKRLRRNLPPLALDPTADIADAAEQLASYERARLNLGDGPIPRLRTVLEESVGIFVFTIEELATTHISGLFTFSNDIRSSA